MNRDFSVYFNDRNIARLGKILIDLLVLSSAFAFSYLLRFDFVLNERTVTTLTVQLPFVLLIQYLSMLIFGVYAFVWRYTGLREAKVFLSLTAFEILPLLLARIFLPESFQLLRVPISIIIIHAILSFCGVYGVRALRRILFEQIRRQINMDGTTSGSDNLSNGDSPAKKERVFLIGAGQAGLMAAKEILNHKDSNLDIKGFIDDDLTKFSSVIYGIKVLGPTQHLDELVRKHKINHVIITIAQTSRKEIKRIVKECERIPIKVRIIPGYYELLGGKIEINKIRDVNVEDLLGRERVDLNDSNTAEFLSDKRVMITGAGGSIGSELVRQVIRYQPEMVLMVERSEFALYKIHREITNTIRHDFICLPLIADICDTERMQSIFSKFKPDIVLHAAAHKHVPMMEFNPAEAIKNNAVGTWVLGDLAGKNNVDTFVLISTDKAVNSTSVMGASKRCAELFVQALDEHYATKYLAVRFGNVLGSTGSVIPLFREQIRNGGPVTVTHPDITRYFMTIPEASQLVLQAGAMGKGSEIFILDMGDPVKIKDLADQMIRMSGFVVDEEISIEYTGLRPGEKLFEELNASEDTLDTTSHPKIFIGRIKKYPAEQLDQIKDELVHLSSNGHEIDLRKFLQEILPEAKITIEQ